MFYSTFLDYRDPIFGIIIIVLFIFITSFLTYTYGLFKEKKQRKEYRKLLKRFEIGDLKEEDYIHLYSTYNLPFDSILLLASSYLNKGKYNKAISVYLTLLEHVDDKVKKEELLELLGNTYFKSGLLQRSKDIYLQILKFSPRNIEVLKQLLLVFQTLKEYNKAEEVLDSLQELDEIIIQDRIYIKVLKIIDDPLLSFEVKSNRLYHNFKINKRLERLVAEFLIKFNKDLFWNHIDEFNILKIIDLLWYLDFEDINFNKVKSNSILEEIYTAKGYIENKDRSDIFELNILIALQKSILDVDIDLNFEFICSKCKRSHPMYTSRCPHCHKILTFIVEPKLAKPIKNMFSLQ
ncbi:MAG: tetratricopeptide repeat protein [Campylobacterota bacterium]|nr:tetratricopeptide repeat protein [Campylobacterota bacterium]